MELTTEEQNIFDGLDVKLEPINSENDRRNHKRKFMDEDSEREICGKIMLTTSLHHHMQNIHNTSSNDEECECEPCRKKFRTADILLKHMQIKHDRVEHQTECRQRRKIRDAKTVRAKKFQRKSGKMKHIEKNIHVDSQSNQQNTDQSILSIENSVEDPIKQETKKRSCHICAKLLHSKSLNSHMKHIHGIIYTGKKSKSFECYICKMKIKCEKSMTRILRNSNVNCAA